MREIAIESGGVRIRARLLSTPTAEIVWRALPLFSTLRFWGRLVRFDLPLEAYREPKARDVLRKGEIAFSPDRDDLFMGYGATPIAERGEIRLPSPANVFAVAIDDADILRQFRDGAEVAIRAAARPAKARA